MTTRTPERSVGQIQEIARRMRIEAVKMIHEARSGHPGGSLSAADIVAALYFRVLRHDPANPDWPDRDRFILSKGHGVPIQYAALAEAGYFDKSLLPTLRQVGSPLQGHPSKKDLAGIEASTGSLGQGLSIGLGIALAARLDGKDFRTYVMMGDGELNEGQVWEAAMAGAHFGVDNLTAIVDRNHYQLDEATAEIMELEPLGEKWKTFGWHTIEIDGHDVGQILAALDEAAKTTGRPTVIIATTVKGKGVSFMENNNEFHGMATDQEQLALALQELGAEGS